MTLHYVNGGEPAGVYPVVAEYLNIFQALAFLEIVHSAIGLVRSPLFTTFIQVLSRLVLIFVMAAVPQAQASVFITSCVAAWSVTEIVRYLFYFTGLFDATPYLLTYLRYTLFIALYPIGVASEIAIILTAQPHMQGSTFTPTLPFNLPTATIDLGYLYFFSFVALLAYLPGFPQLYFYMLAQRKKVLGGSSSDKKKKSA
eukprot:TRINITY_DN7529_c0_g1_i2.p2 TRINITY_DN7529_c0_g1~~TRINITY_DN7529_c0_g1_i2.p2  ORF type:complete len:200 (+),score=50.86 TRINITY_DN7529_c0_g1_i2:89-688(+)